MYRYNQHCDLIDWLFFVGIKVAHVFSWLLLFTALLGVREALYIDNPDVHLYEHAGTINI